MEAESSDSKGEESDGQEQSEPEITDLDENEKEEDSNEEVQQQQQVIFFYFLEKKIFYFIERAVLIFFESSDRIRARRDGLGQRAHRQRTGQRAG